MAFPGSAGSRTSASRASRFSLALPAVVFDEPGGARRRRRARSPRRSPRARPRPPRAGATAAAPRPSRGAGARQCSCALWLDQRVARGGVDRVVEGDVGLDHRLDVAAARGAPAGLDQRGIERRRVAPRRGARPARRARRAPRRPGRSRRRRAARRARRGRARRRTRPSFFSRRSACSTGWRETASRAAMSSCVRRAPGASEPSLIASSRAR